MFFKLTETCFHVDLSRSTHQASVLVVFIEDELLLMFAEFIGSGVIEELAERGRAEAGAVVAEVLCSEVLALGEIKGQTGRVVWHPRRCWHARRCWNRGCGCSFSPGCRSPPVYYIPFVVRRYIIATTTKKESRWN